MKKLFIILALFVFTLNSQLMARSDITAFCYHQVEPAAKNKFSLSLDRFRSQLKYLKDRNFESLNSEELLKAIASGTPDVSRKVVFTFDDGYKTVYDYAFPAMQEFGFKGIVCIYPSFIGSSLAMSWEQLAELIKAGWSVECHSMSHSNLASKYHTPEVEKAFLEHEIVAARHLIENRLGNKVKFMVWPYGVYSDRSIKTAMDAGFSGAMTVDGGANYQGMSPWQIKRQVIYSTDDMEKFLIRFGMAALPITEHYPAPGQVVDQLATFSCRIDNLSDYSPEKYVLNAKATGKKVTFNFDNQTRMLTATVTSPFASGNYFIDVYLRDKKTGVTAQHGWLFSIAGAGNRTSY